jgi:divalent metal cation (Fe/Co/Zn/Cd) transporter
MTDSAVNVVPDTTWLRLARWVRWLAWASLGWMTVEGVVGLAAGFEAGSIALMGWAFSSVLEGLASVIVIWRFSQAQMLVAKAEQRAQKAVAISFWLLAPYVAAGSIRDLVTRHQPGSTLVGILLTLSSLSLMPALGIVKQRLGARLGSGATAGEGAQNLLCAYLAAAVLAGLIANSLWGWWWLDPVTGLAVSAAAVREGISVWRGKSCCGVAAVPTDKGCACTSGLSDPCCERVEAG